MMKLCMYVIFILTIKFAYGDHASNLINFINRFSLHENSRVPRDASSSSASSCVSKCMTGMLNHMKNDPQISQSISGFEESFGSSCSMYSLPVFKGLCSAYLDAKKCWPTCPNDNVTKPFVTTAFEGSEFMCVTRYDDFLRVIPCINSTCTEFDDKCAPQCSKYKPSMAKMFEMEQTNDRTATENSTMSKMVSDMCQYIGCSQDCLNGLVAKKCSSDAPRLLNELLKRMVNSMSSLLSQMGMIDTKLPPACMQLADRPGLGSSAGTRRMSLLAMIISVFLVMITV